jgi:hypothetical protein
MKGKLLRVPSSLLEEYMDDSSLLKERIQAVNNDPALLELDKSWEGLFYLLTGFSIDKHQSAKPPLSWVILSHQIIDEEQDLGNGPAHYLTPSQVQLVSDALSSVSEEDLRLKYDSATMMQLAVYPQIWNEEDALPYLVDYFNKLKPFYEKAANQGEAIISYIH